MDRAEHLQWCKDRALAYLNTGDVQQAFSSMASDLAKHPDTAHHRETMMLGLGELQNNDVAGMRRFIKGFN